jgi:O-antigen biosynthesis protein WbqP
MYKKYIKRLFDVILSFIGIVVLALPMLLVAIIIKLDTPGPVLFKQKRIGIHKSEFYILKFRSMKIDVPNDVPTHLLADSESFMTGWQKFMRKTSIDELPQLFNILKGDVYRAFSDFSEGVFLFASAARKDV